MKNLFRVIVTVSIAVAASAPAQQRNSTPVTERRVALVIANAAYTADPLKSPINDGRDITQTLKSLRFEVIHKENLSQNDMKRVIREFGAKIRQGGVSLFYYVGHGVQVRGENYLMPVDFTPSNEDEVEYEAVNAGLVLAQMAAARNSVNIMILDACRNNPFTRSFRSTSDGLARMSAPNGTLIAYATAPGMVTIEGSEVSNGIYTQELLRFISVPGLSIEEVFKRVRIAVRAKTRNKQTPWEESSLTDNFYFAKNKTGGVSPPTNAASSAKPSIEDESISGNKQTKSNVDLDGNSAAKINAQAAVVYRRVLSQKHKEDYAKTVAEYREKLRLEPNNAFYHNMLGHTLRKKAEQDWFEMVQAQEKAKRKAEKKRMWLAILATATAIAIGGPGAPAPRMPEWELPGLTLPPFNMDEEVIAELEAAVELEPSNAKYHSDFGMALFDFRNDLTIVGTEAEVPMTARAEMALREAVRLEPNNPIFLSNLGAALISQHRWTEAEAKYRTLLGLDPNNVSHHIGLLKALDGQKKWTDAAQVYIGIQRLKPDSSSKSLISAEIKDKKELRAEIKRLKK